MEKKQKTLGNKGFSLVELIIVIAIMAVLVVVLAPQFIKFVEKGRESTDLQNITELKTAVETYVADKALPSTSADIVITANPSLKTIVVSGGPSSLATDLSAYGVNTSTPLESQAWNANIVWTYSAYKWTLGGTTVPQAEYLDANGKEVP